MIVKTKNSVYEIDDGRIRCLSTKNPDRETGITEEWRKFADKLGPREGESLRIFWPDDNCTTTSIVTKIEDDEPELGWVL